MSCSQYTQDCKDINNLLVNVAVPENYLKTLRNLNFIQRKIHNISFWLEPLAKGPIFFFSYF